MHECMAPVLFGRSLRSAAPQKEKSAGTRARSTPPVRTVPPKSLSGIRHRRLPNVGTDAGCCQTDGYAHQASDGYRAVRTVYTKARREASRQPGSHSQTRPSPPPELRQRPAWPAPVPRWKALVRPPTDQPQIFDADRSRLRLPPPRRSILPPLWRARWRRLHAHSKAEPQTVPAHRPKRPPDHRICPGQTVQSPVQRSHKLRQREPRRLKRPVPPNHAGWDAAPSLPAAGLMRPLPRTLLLSFHLPGG